MSTTRLKKSCTECSSCPAFSKSVFAETEPALQDQLDQAKEQRTYGPKEEIFRAGQPPKGVFCIHSGRVRHSFTGLSGKTHVLSFSEGGDLIGASATVTQGSLKADAVAEGHVQGCFIPADSLMRIVTNSGKICLATFRKVSDELSFYQDRLENMMEKQTRARIASALLYFDKTHADNWARKDLAEWAGTTIENVIRTLASFEEKAYVKRSPGAVKILDREAIVEIANS